MALACARFISLLFTGLAMAPAFAHLASLPNKIGLPRDEYFVVQQIYRGWALLGVVVFAALISTLVLTFMLRKRQKRFKLALVAFLCIVGTQILFWTFTFPANQQTVDWTVAPADWTALRTQWEYSHAASAVLNVAAFIALIASVARPRRRVY